MKGNLFHDFSWSVLKLHVPSLYCKYVNDGLPKGSELEPLLYLIDVNDLAQGLKPDVNICLMMVIRCFQTFPLNLTVT